MGLINTPDFDNFDTDTLFVNSTQYYIIVGNFFFMDDPLARAGKSRRFNYKSGISEQAFHALMEDFANRRDLEIILASDDVVVMAGDYADYQAICRDNGSRFSYDFVNGQKVREFVNYTKKGEGVVHSSFKEMHLDA